MKLSQLVNYKNELENMSVKHIQRRVNIEVENITHTVDSQSIQILEFSKLLQQKKNHINSSFDDFETTLDDLKSQINNLIEASEKPLFQESYRLYEQEMINEPTEYILDRRANISEETEKFYRTRIVRYNSWQYPAMIIRPGRETYVNELVATDPLYLVDESYDLLKPAANLFNQQYQQRLRLYTINERTDEPMLKKLPDGQFGLVFAYNFFNFRPLEVLKKYLVEIFAKLRPGGVLAMTFNDCDRDKAVMLVEQHFCCYTPGYLVRELAQSIGYEIVFSWTDQGPTTWIELKKPGQHDSLRGGQTLAKILPKPVADSK